MMDKVGVEDLTYSMGCFKAHKDWTLWCARSKLEGKKANNWRIILNQHTTRMDQLQDLQNGLYNRMTRLQNGLENTNTSVNECVSTMEERFGTMEASFSAVEKRLHDAEIRLGALQTRFKDVKKKARRCGDKTEIRGK